MIIRKLAGLALTAIVLAAPLANVQASANRQAALPKVDLVMWHQEGEDTMKSIGLQKIFDDWAAKNAPGSTLSLVAKDTEKLRTDFQAAALAGSGGPDVLWTVADQAGPFTTAGLIQPVDSVVDMKLFIPSIASITNIGGKTYGIPLQAGNHLMLFYNKSLVKTPPATFADLVKVAKQLATDNAKVANFTGFAYNQQESFWVFPIAHGFGGTEFAKDGKTPVLDTPEWVKTYQLLYDLKYKDQVEPKECDYACADGGFTAGTAAMILNGDWALGGDKGYIKLLGDNLGIATWPSVGDDPTKNIPAPFIAGKFLMFPNSLKGDKLTTASAFAKFLTTDEPTVLTWTVTNGRLPAVTTALKNDKVTKDPILSASAKVLITGIAQPVQPEMRCAFDAVTTETRAIMGDTVKPADAATAAQKSAVDCIAKLQ
jgi:maltose-binding protein MalE